jgi:hypothetical protein
MGRHPVPAARKPPRWERQLIDHGYGGLRSGLQEAPRLRGQGGATGELASEGSAES